jgi:hypothetical protein
VSATAREKWLFMVKTFSSCRSPQLHDREAVRFYVDVRAQHTTTVSFTLWTFPKLAISRRMGFWFTIQLLGSLGDLHPRNRPNLKWKVQIINDMLLALMSLLRAFTFTHQITLGGNAHSLDRVSQGPFARHNFTWRHRLKSLWSRTRQTARNETISRARDDSGERSVVGYWFGSVVSHGANSCAAHYRCTIAACNSL